MASDVAASELTEHKTTARPPAHIATAIWLLAAFAFLGALYVGKPLLVPLAIAIGVWYLINAGAAGLGEIPVVGRIPHWIRQILAAIALLGVVQAVIALISSNVSAMADAVPVYEQNLVALADRLSTAWGIPIVDTVEDFFRDFDFTPWVRSLASALGDFVGSAGLVIVYVVFLLVEQTRVDAKLNALFPDEGRRVGVRIVLSKIQREIRTYVWVKTLMSVLTGLLSYGVLAYAGVDYAPFWAFIIFLLNYIPTIGSTLGVVFPALMTLVQFDTFTTFLLVTPVLATIQIVIGNVLEPPLMGRSLNISPLVVILSLVLWGTIWGMAGMFLCVPIMVSMLIVFAQFPETRSFAVVLSSTGKV
jgi:predicted PurR-regulated permease PerM